MQFYLFSTFFIINLIAGFLCTKSFKLRFEAQTIDAHISIGYGLALGDVDGDGKPDILLADKKQFVWYRNGDWKRFVMVDSLTTHDNVCIAARDINGDGKVEVAVGAQWNPGETTDSQNSGSVHYLVRPSDPTKLWKAVKLHHEPTTHRMQWVRFGVGKYALIVVPLHGRGNKEGQGEGVRVLAYHYPKDVYGSWQIDSLEKTMHLTHNFDVTEDERSSKVYLAGKEGVNIIEYKGNLARNNTLKIHAPDRGVGEVRIGKLSATTNFIATIESMHGSEVVVYPNDASERIIVDNNIKEGHALATADLLGAGSDQIIAGWRAANKENKVGIKLYSKQNANGTTWKSYWIDENGMACEDLKIMDMNGDNRPDIVASGRSTHNLKIYWNR